MLLEVNVDPRKSVGKREVIGNNVEGGRLEAVMYLYAKQYSPYLLF